MTELLEKALAKVSQLSPEAQDAIAALILEELEDEQRWDTAFAASQRELAKLAEKVRGDIRAGRIQVCSASVCIPQNPFTRFGLAEDGAPWDCERKMPSTGSGLARM